MIAKLLIIPLILAIFAIAWFGRGFFESKKTPSPTPVPVPTQTVAPVIVTPAPTPVPTDSGPQVPSGWQTYTNSQYGFSISYPSNYKALSDKDNLYGWPDAIVLLYSGGQAYNIAIEVWDTESAYKLKYPTEALSVYEVNGKFITISDQTKSAQNQDIIATFHLSK